MSEDDVDSSDSETEDEAAPADTPKQNKPHQLPAVAREVGFVSRELPYVSHGKFTAIPGPKQKNQSLTPLAALKLFVSTSLVEYLLRRARAFVAEKSLQMEPMVDDFWRYFSAVLGHGIVQYPEEQDAYVGDKRRVAGLLGNELLRRLHSFDEWQRAKQMFTGTRDDLTDHFNRTAKELWNPSQKQAVDEGGLPSWANTEGRKYTPGKPHPNAIEYLLAVGEEGFGSNMVWSDDKRPKYGLPEGKLAQMVMYVDYFTSQALQPYIFYIDARWSSLPLIQYIHEQKCYGILSCSVTMRPQKLLRWLRGDLEKGDWWSIGYTPAHANLITIRTKKKVYLNILTNWATTKQTKEVRRKRKPPMNTYTTKASAVQSEYNKFKSAVDRWNKALLEYYRLGRFLSTDLTYTLFFIHALTLQAYTYYNASTGAQLSQLQFRKSLLQELVSPLFPQLGDEPTRRDAICWPTSMAPHRHRCQYPPCRNVCTNYCHRCKMWGCQACLWEAHKPK